MQILKFGDFGECLGVAECKTSMNQMCMHAHCKLFQIVQILYLVCTQPEWIWFNRNETRTDTTFTLHTLTLPRAHVMSRDMSHALGDFLVYVPWQTTRFNMHFSRLISRIHELTWKIEGEPQWSVLAFLRSPLVQQVKMEIVKVRESSFDHVRASI